MQWFLYCLKLNFIIQKLHFMKSIRKILFSPITMLFLLVVLITALATATFIENDFGAEIAKTKVYNSRWLEIILLLLTINLTGRIFLLKLFSLKKFSVFLFHIAFVVMILGASFTRYFGYEGSMHIRENSSSSTLVTNKKVVALSFDNGKSHEFSANIEYNNSFKSSIENNNNLINIELVKYYKNAYPKAIESENGIPIIGFVLAGESYRGFDYLTNGEIKNYGNITMSFNSNLKSDVSFFNENDSVYLISILPVYVSNMGEDAVLINSNEKISLENKKLYKINNSSFVLQEFFQKAVITAIPTEVKGHKRGSEALVFDVSDKYNSTELTIWGNSENNQISWGKLSEQTIGLSYGYKTIELPFNIYLEDFSIERYPGSMSPSSFSSRVRIYEDGKEPVPFHIYMNNILKHHGYRFYQSSYDKDERGTILSVNHDIWGTLITYFGYFLMTLGIVWSMINSNSFFRRTVLHNTKSKIIALIIIAGGLSSFNAQAQNSNNQHTTNPHASGQTMNHTHNKEHKTLPDNFVAIDLKQSEKFGKLFIQNNKGRTEPIYTYASELMRKISRKEKMYGLSPVQLFMEMNMNPNLWVDIPIIRISNKELQSYIGISSNYASYSDFISNETGYKLQQLVQRAFAKSPAEQSKFDKAVIKTDEKVNICYAIFSGNYMKILPLPDNTDVSHWFTPMEAQLKANNANDSIFLANILPAYYDEVNNARVSGDYTHADEFLDGLINYQIKNAAYDLPSNLKKNIEVLYYKYNPFKKLFPFYAASGVLFLFILIAFIVVGKAIPNWLNKSFFTIILAAFIFHTLGIIARWYISGHAPMSNGYESMIFISWVTLLAGFLFNKRSPFALPATAALGGLTLMVANLSFMDPQITNLVPVLQSYWLTIHVSVITGSYGFLALGALLGIINLILIILRTNKNHQHIVETLESLTIINHKTLIAGLYLLTIGTFLGAVWANESWGRYWGWDPKETWALISILVYTIVTHARLIPGMKGIFTFNTLSLFAFSSILMTYFGVNYYLSGLHSYASGDPVPVPMFVYYTLAAIVFLTLFASIRFKSFVEKPKE